jgi:hypothetical protein
MTDMNLTYPWELATSRRGIEIIRATDGNVRSYFVIDEAAADQVIDKAVNDYVDLMVAWSENAAVAKKTPPGANAPYKIKMQGDEYAVVNNAGVTKASFPTRAKALLYLRALYANVPGAAAKAAKKKWTGKAKNVVPTAKARAENTPLIAHKFAPKAGGHAYGDRGSVDYSFSGDAACATCDAPMSDHAPSDVADQSTDDYDGGMWASAYDYAETARGGAQPMIGPGYGKYIPHADPGYHPDGVPKLPIDTPGNVLASAKEIAKGAVANRYTSPQGMAIKVRIRAAAKKHGVKVAI